MQDNDNSKVSADKAIAAVAARLSDYSFLEQKGVLHEYSESALIPSAKALEELVELCRSVFFPGFYGQTPSYPPLGGGLVDMVRRVHELLASQIAAGLYLDERPKTGESCTDVVRKEAECIATEVVEHLPEVKSMLETDVEAAYKGDPAATTYSEVVSCYPAIRAISSA